MDVLLLIPDNQPAKAAAGHARNVGLITHRDVNVPYRGKDAKGKPEVQSKLEHHDAIPVTIPASVFREVADSVACPWSFTFANYLTGEAQGLFLPTPQSYGEFRASLHYSRASSSTSDTATLLINIQANSANLSISVFDPLTDEEIELGTTRFLFFGNNYLKHPQTIRIGPHRFRVGYPTDSGTLEHPAFKLSLARHVAPVRELSVDRDFFQSLRRKLGEGSFGYVDLKRSLVSGALRAAKCADITTGDDVAVAKFDEEGKRLRLANAHSGSAIVRFYGKIVEHSANAGHTKHSLLLQPCHGSLRDLIIDQNAVIRFKTIAAALCQGILDLHKAAVNLIHCDIKPDNIFFWVENVGERGYDDKYRLEALQDSFTDIKFCVGDLGHSQTNDGFNILNFGTLRYMAPEITGYFFYSEAIDKFAAGVTLLEVLHPPTVHDAYARYELRVMATGRRDRRNLYAYHDELRNAPVPIHVQPTVWRLIQTLLAPNPMNRPDLRVVADVLSMVDVYSLDGSLMESLMIEDANGKKIVNPFLHVGYIGQELDKDDFPVGWIGDEFLDFIDSQDPANLLADGFSGLPTLPVPELPADAFASLPSTIPDANIHVSPAYMPVESAEQAAAVARAHIAYVNARRHAEYNPPLADESFIREEDLAQYRSARDTLEEQWEIWPQVEEESYGEQWVQPVPDNQAEPETQLALETQEEQVAQFEQELEPAPETALELEGHLDQEISLMPATQTEQHTEAEQEPTLEKERQEEGERQEGPERPPQGGKRPRGVLSGDSAVHEMVPRRREKIAQTVVRRSERIKALNGS